MFSWRGFCLSLGPPFLPPAFLSLPVTTTCSSCPHGTGLCSRKQGRGRMGDAPATLKRSIGQGLLPTGAQSQEERERGRGPLHVLTPPPLRQPSCLLWQPGLQKETYPLEPGLASQNLGTFPRVFQSWWYILHLPSNKEASHSVFLLGIVPLPFCHRN